MAGVNTVCFAWLIGFKKSCNKRWARFCNRLRQRYYARRGKILVPDTLLNETGTAEMIVEKISYKSNKVVSQNLSPKNDIVFDDAVDADVTTLTESKAEDKNVAGDTIVEEFVACIIEKAARSLRQELPSNVTTVTVMPADDNISMSSSIISQIADIAVTESLSNVVTEADINHSAIRAAKTIKEFKEAFGITGYDVTDDGLPPVSE